MSSVERQVTLGDYRGIHGRTARTIVSIVKRHGVTCTITARHPDGGRDGSGNFRQMSVNALSMLNLLALGAPFGSQLTLHVEGEQANAAANALAEYLAFGPYSDTARGQGQTNSDPALLAMPVAERAAYLQTLTEPV